MEDAYYWKLFLMTGRAGVLSALLPRQKAAGACLGIGPALHRSHYVQNF